MLDEKLLQERLSQFRPKPLITFEMEKDEILEIPMVEEDEINIDLAKTNFLNMLDNEKIKKSSEEYIRKYGVGCCGPRAFYGTTDIHLNLEEGLAKFLQAEESIIYAYGFVAISSSIAAYCNKKDVVFIDKEANFPIHQGLLAARSTVVYFDHNDPKSLQQCVEKQVADEKQTKKNSRKFLIIEGINWKTGKLCPLPEFMEVAEKYKMRIFLEESYSIGVFGRNGRGLTEHFNIAIDRIDMIFGTVEGSIGSIGGFCAGSKLLIEHQRLSGAGYIFSASLPTYLCQVVLESINLLQDKPEKFQKFAEAFHQFLVKMCKFDVSSHPKSPFKVFSTLNNEKDENIYRFCKQNGVHFIKKEYGLTINLNLNLKDDNIRLEKVFNILEKSSKL